MKHTPFVFVDIETTGMSPRTGGRILEIAALRMEDHQIVEKVDTLINPETDVPYFITTITGIADEHVAQAPLFADVIDELEHISKDAIFVAHNVNFDYGFIQEEYRKLGARFSRQRLCTVQLSRALFPFERGHSLGKIIERHGYQVSDRHRAFADAEVLYRFWRDMYQRDSLKLLATTNRLIR